MTELMNMIDGVRRRRDLTQEKFARCLDMSLNTYARQKRGLLKVGLESIRRYASFAVANGEPEMLDALSEYALGTKIIKE